YAAAVVGHVAFAGGWPADSAARLELIGWTGRARAGAAFRYVAWTGRRPANGAGGLELIGRTIVVCTVAALRHVAHARRWTALGCALGVSRAESARSGTALGQ